MEGNVQRAPWIGEKTDRLNIRITPDEKRELQLAAEALGSMGISRYLLTLHRKYKGKLKGRIA